MTEMLHQRFARLMDEVLPSAGSSRREDQAAHAERLFEIMGYVLVLRLTGDIGRSLSGRSRAALVRETKKALLRADGKDEDLRYAADIARQALNALSDEPIDPTFGDVVAPPPQRIIAMLQGRPDGLSAGACALGVMRHAEARRVVETLLVAEAGPTPMRVAAQAEEVMRDPDAGVRVATLMEPAAEAVLFESNERMLAIYAEERAPIRLSGNGVTTRQMLPGYWLGTIETNQTSIAARLEVGNTSVRWTIVLDAER